MKQYRLLKDLPTIKAGAIFQEITREVDGSKILKEYDSNNKNTMLVSEIKNFDEWFEEVKEPIDSIHWKPKIGDKCFILENANIRPTNYTGMLRDYNAWHTGRVFRTEEECEKALDRELAEARLRRTSTFKPDFEDANGGWTVYYSYKDKKLSSFFTGYDDAGEIVSYATEEEAEKSIRENERDWKIFFGIKEEE